MRDKHLAILTAFSTALAGVHLILAIAYLRPPIRTPGAPSVVGYIESLGPIWTLSFAFSGLLLLVSIHWVRCATWISNVHAIAAGVSLFYGLAVLSGQLLAEPPRLSPTFALALGVTAAHIALSRLFVERSRQ